MLRVAQYLTFGLCTKVLQGVDWPRRTLRMTWLQTIR